MKQQTLKILKIIWKVIKFIVTIGKSHEEKYLSKEDTNFNSNTLGD